MNDLKIKDLRFKYIDYSDRVMVVFATNATNKTLNEALEHMAEWDKDRFKALVEREGFMIDFIRFETY